QRPGANDATGDDDHAQGIGSIGIDAHALSGGNPNGKPNARDYPYGREDPVPCKQQAEYVPDIRVDSDVYRKEVHSTQSHFALSRGHFAVATISYFSTDQANSVNLATARMPDR